MKDLSHRDASWANVNPCIWSIVENGTGKLLADCYTLSISIHAKDESNQALSAPVFPRSDPYSPWP